MSGNEELQKESYVTDKIGMVNEQIDAIEKQFGVYTISHNPDIDDTLNMSEEELEKLTPNECSKSGFLCIQYCISVQRAINRSRAIKSYCLRALDLVIAKEYNNYKKGDKFTPSDIVRLSVINGNSYAKKLSELILQEEIKISSLEDLIKHAQNMSLVFKNLSYTKRGERDVY